ncbi:DUF4846 domain-containing protein [bacterium]|nr:DUF4846 domain-containing protein [bacterium]
MKRFLLLLLFIVNICLAQNPAYPWLFDSIQDRVLTIQLPDGYERPSYGENTFQFWLQNLPLKDKDQPVLLFNGATKGNQNAHFRIINMDVGEKDLQQCADAVMRLYAEYLYWQNHYTKIHFNFTSGDKASFDQWGEGYRPVVRGQQVSWIRKQTADSSYKILRDYLNIVFLYAGSYSFSQELKNIQPEELGIGDIFIQGGFPGHAVIVVDKAENENNEAIFLLAQSYMPAQEMHILKNPSNNSLSPWYRQKESGALRTPEWTFDWSDLKRFKY